MRFTATDIAGVMIVDAEARVDDRGGFARLHCPDEFAAAGIPFEPVQTSLSTNPRVSTLRGLHYQRSPHAERKLVRAVRGAVFDVAVDLRPDSPTFRRWVSADLSAGNRRALFIPEGVAHGFLTLEPDTEVLYQIAPAHTPGYAAGVRWNDPAFGIVWPAAPALMSTADAAYPDAKAP